MKIDAELEIIRKTYPKAIWASKNKQIYSTMGPPHNYPCKKCGEIMPIGECWIGKWVHKNCV